MSGRYADLVGDEQLPGPPAIPKPRREDTWDNPAWKLWHDSHDKGRCPWDIPSQTFTSHGDGCKHPEFDQDYWQELIAVKERAAALRAETAPKSLRVGRITDRESSRREAEQMARTFQDDPRPTPCMRYCYGQMAARWFEAGSVYVMAAASWLAERSGGRFTEKQCRTAIDRLEDLGYLDPVKWSRVKKADPGLYAYAKRHYAGDGGRWAQVYLMRQDLPEQDVIPPEENPILRMFDLVPA